jgi:hypothetical protein
MSTKTPGEKVQNVSVTSVVAISERCTGVIVNLRFSLSVFSTISSSGPSEIFLMFIVEIPNTSSRSRSARARATAVRKDACCVRSTT